MESLYVLSLQYLRKNYQLINFTALDADTSRDMAAIMADPYYLSNHCDFKCRYWYERDALHLYMAEHHLDSKWVIEVPAPDLAQNHQIIRWTAGTPSSRFVYMSTKELHDLNTDKYYKFNHPISDEFKHNVYTVEIKNVITKPGPLMWQNITEIVEDRVFDMFPGFLEWAEKNNFVSEQIVMNRRSILKKQNTRQLGP
jgi:hypothetical protein